MFEINNMKGFDMTSYIGYIGTYTKKESKGIYQFTLDTEKKMITDVQLAAKLENPTYIAVSKDKRNLFAVTKNGEQGGITSFSVGTETGTLTKLNSILLDGAPPCYVSVNNINSKVLSANYHTKKLVSYKLNQDGSFNNEISIVNHEGSGPHERQEKSHLHFADFTPDGKYIIVVDLGSDRIITYTNTDDELNEVNSFSAKPGSGPRHITFHPNGKFAYAVTELSSEVIMLYYDAEDGSFKDIQYISTVPEEFREGNDASAVVISSDGKYLYVGNRRHSSIAIYKIDENNGELTFLEWTPTMGNWPRDFVLDPTEEFLVATNEKTNNMTLFSRNRETGRLTLLQSNIKVPEPVCVKFL